MSRAYLNTTDMTGTLKPPSGLPIIPRYGFKSASNPAQNDVDLLGHRREDRSGN